MDAGCARWRRAENKFAPTPGHVLAIANPIFASRRFLAQHAAQITGMAMPGARTAPPRKEPA